MFKSKMELMLRIITQPLVEDTFYKSDYIESLYNKESIKEYREYYRKDVGKKIYSGLHKYNTINNLDEVDLLFEKFYSYYKIKEYNDIDRYYVDIISKLSKCFICHRNGKISFKYWESEDEESFIGPYSGINKAIMWNLLNRIFTTDLLVVNYLRKNGMNDEIYLDGYYNSIALEDIQLEKILQKGVAETHIHRGAGINFYISWIQLMSNISNLDAKDIYKEALFNDSVLNLEYDLSNRVKSVAILRISMAIFMKHRKKGYSNEYYSKYLEDRFKSGSKIQNIVEYIYSAKNIVLENNIIKDCWNEILNELDIPQSSKLMDEDILEKIYITDIRTNLENIFLLDCLNYIDESDDKYFAKLFWQYIRVKNQVLSLKVQGNSIKGLDNFSSYYDRSTNLFYYDKKEYWKLLINMQLQSSHIRKVEFRASMGNEKNKKAIKKNIKNIMIKFLEVYLDILNEYDDYSLDYPKIGLVFHMIKYYDKSNPEKCWKNFKNKKHHYSEEILYKKIQEKYINEIQALNEIREEIPKLSEYIIGIDAASVESKTEPWVFAPVYRLARDSSTHKLFIQGERNKKLQKTAIKNLGFTYHVGEDFRHLMSGLRYIDEVLTHFSFHSGDRIGHGIALGVSPKTWYDDNRIVTMPRIEYMENLLWLWGLYKDGLYSEGFDVGYLELEIMKLAEQIYLKIDGITIYSLWKSYQSRFDEFKLDDDFSFKNACERNFLFCKNAKSIYAISWNEEKLSKTYHCKCYLRRMLEPIQVKVNKDDIDKLINIQRIVISKVNEKGVIVETNPTSNCIIGSIENIFEHYIHRLNSIDDMKYNKNKLIVSINSDDPSVFNTNVSNEFAYIYYSLLDKGYNREDILIWIDKIRSYGMESSFIDNKYLNIEDKKNEIIYILDNLNNM